MKITNKILKNIERYKWLIICADELTWYANDMKPDLKLTWFVNQLLLKLCTNNTVTRHLLISNLYKDNDILTQKYDKKFKDQLDWAAVAHATAICYKYGVTNPIRNSIIMKNVKRFNQNEFPCDMIDIDNWSGALQAVFHPDVKQENLEYIWNQHTDHRLFIIMSPFTKSYTLKKLFSENICKQYLELLDYYYSLRVIEEERSFNYDERSRRDFISCR